MSDQKFVVRIIRKNNSANALVYRQRADAIKSVDEILGGMQLAKMDPNSQGVVVRLSDDYGYDMILDCGEIAAAWAVGMFDINNQQNEFEMAQRKGAMHLNALIEADGPLKTFLRMAAGQGRIVPPNGAGNAG